MRFHKLRVVLLFLVMVFGLVACSNQSVHVQTQVPVPGELPTQTAAMAQVDVQSCLSQAGVPTAGEMKALILEKLMDHHDISRIDNARHTREEWNATLDRMIGYGAIISESEKQVIIDYLLCLQQ